MQEIPLDFPVEDKCPRCGERLRAWSELTEEERELAHRLSAAADQSFADERALRNRWCPRCWYEEILDEPRLA